MIKRIAGIILGFALDFSFSLAFGEEQTSYCLHKESWDEGEHCDE